MNNVLIMLIASAILLLCSLPVVICRYIIQRKPIDKNKAKNISTAWWIIALAILLILYVVFPVQTRIIELLVFFIILIDISFSKIIFWILSHGHEDLSEPVCNFYKITCENCRKTTTYFSYDKHEKPIDVICPKCNTINHINEQKNYNFTEEKKGNCFMKLYKIIIIYAACAALVVVSYVLGYSKKYDNSYIAESFKKNKNQFEELTNTQTIYNEQSSKKESLSSEVDNIQKQLNTIMDFEAKQDSYQSELQKLSDDMDNLSSQKNAKEKTLNDIEYDLSQY